MQPQKSEKISNIATKIIDNALRVMLVISTSLLFVMMLITVVDVSGRYFFKTPLNGANEATGFLLVAITACAFAYTQNQKTHIRVQILTEHLPVKAQAAVDLFNYVISLLIVSLISWQMIVVAKKFFLNLSGGSTISEELSIPFWPFYALLGLGFLVFAVQLLSELIFSIARKSNK